MAAAIESSQMSIRELADFITHLDEAVAFQPEPDKLRTAVVEALSAECVQCSISVPGSDLQKLPHPEFSDPKLDRLRSGYCARNGCDSNFYRVIRAPHPQIDWPKLLNPAREIAENKIEAERAEIVLAKTARRHRNFVRTAAIIGALLLVLLLRQIYIGGTIPFIREPEKFRVDREP